MATSQQGGPFASLAELFSEIWQTVEAPDYQGGRWFELYRGSAMDETFIVVDFTWNVLHVQRNARHALTVTFLPGWFYEHVSLALKEGMSEDYVPGDVEDLASATPWRYELSVEDDIAVPDTTADGVEFTRLPFGYEFEPAHAFASQEGETVQRAQWGAMKLRLIAAPGVSFAARRVVAQSTLDEARAAYGSRATYPRLFTVPSVAQTLQFTLERRQDPSSIAGLGAPWRTVPLAELDAVAAGATAGESGSALVLEQTRPDGVDILVVRPGTSGSSAPWLAELAATVLNSVVESIVSFQGGLPPEAPLLIRIRVDPESAADRFAYRLTYLDSAQQPSEEPTTDVDPHKPCVRLAVTRTPDVSVSFSGSLSNWGESQLADAIDYREEIVWSLKDVPAFLTAETEPVHHARLPDEPATIEDILTVLYYAGAFAPIPQLQVMYDLEDASSLGTYLLRGTDVWGEEMTAVDAGITLAGFVLPEVAERGFKQAIRSLRSLRTIGDDPASRLVRALEAVDTEDAVLAQELLSRTAAE